MRHGIIICSLASILIFAFLYLYIPLPNQTGIGLSQLPTQILAPSPSNGTLGFGAIYVLTDNNTTWRIQGLLQAAKLVGLELTIPVQQNPSDQEIQDYLAGEKPDNAFDAIRAVLNYISLLEDFLHSGHETALFFEDDVDFSIDIKSQMLVFSEALNLASTPHNTSFPYGKDAWDILWLGHYGIEFTGSTEIIQYADPYALEWSRLTSTFNNYYESLGSRNSMQQILWNVAPLSTYAWAITRAHAEKLVGELRERRVQTMDVALHVGCKSLQQKCLAPVPELMHHHKVTGEKRIGDAGIVDDGLHDLGWWMSRHKYTYNIQWSARCNAAGVGERLGDKWQCLPGRYDGQV